MASSSPFLALPAELRNEILRLAVTQEPPIVFHFILSTVLEGHGKGYSSRRMVCTQQPAIARTCRQLRHEASPIYYGANDFLIDMTGSPNDESRGEWWKELPKYKPDLGILERVTIKFDLNIHGDVEVSFSELLSSTIFFDISTITGSPTSPVQINVRMAAPQHRICFCDAHRHASVVNLVDEAEGLVCGSSVVSLCALLEKHIICNVVLSSWYHSEFCYRCRSPKAMEKSRFLTLEGLRTRAEARDRVETRDRAEVEREMDGLRRKYGGRMSDARIRRLEHLPALEEGGNCVDVKREKANAKHGVFGFAKLMRWAKGKYMGLVRGKRASPGGCM